MRYSITVEIEANSLPEAIQTISETIQAPVRIVSVYQMSEPVPVSSA